MLPQEEGVGVLWGVHCTICLVVASAIWTSQVRNLETVVGISSSMIVPERRRSSKYGQGNRGAFRNLKRRQGYISGAK